MACPKPLLADAYYDAERAAKDFIYYREDFIKLNKSAALDLVYAVSQADDGERKDVAERASREARDKVSADYEKAENRKNEALKLLDAVLKDPAFKDKYRDAEELKAKVNSTWESIQKMSSGLRGSNHPVVAYLIQVGKDLHDTRQRGCPDYEFDTGNGYADCIRPKCDIIEFKPDNSRAKSKAETQLRKYRKGLLENASKRNDLNSKDSRFASCTDFTLTIEAYTLAPEINEDGSFREKSVSWSTYTVSP